MTDEQNLFKIIFRLHMGIKLGSLVSVNAIRKYKKQPLKCMNFDLRSSHLHMGVHCYVLSLAVNMYKAHTHTHTHNALTER